jgi:hypothetical protein
MEAERREWLNESYGKMAFVSGTQRKKETCQKIDAHHPNQQRPRDGTYKGSWQQEQKQ